MAEMKEAMNALGEFQELKSQVKCSDIMIYYLFICLVFSSFYDCG